MAENNLSFLEKIKKCFYILTDKAKCDNSEEEEMEKNINKIYETLLEDELKIVFSENIFEIIDSVNINELRLNLKEKTGLILPLVHCYQDSEFEDNKYQIFINGNIVFEDYTVPVQDYMQEEICFNLEKCCKENLDLLFTGKITEKYFNAVQKNNKLYIWEIGCYITPTAIREILLSLIKINKSIKNIEYVFEQIAQYAYLRAPSKIVEKIKNNIQDFKWEPHFERPDIKLPKLD